MPFSGDFLELSTAQKTRILLEFAESPVFRLTAVKRGILCASGEQDISRNLQQDDSAGQGCQRPQ